MGRAQVDGAGPKLTDDEVFGSIKGLLSVEGGADRESGRLAADAATRKALWRDVVEGLLRAAEDAVHDLGVYEYARRDDTYGGVLRDAITALQTARGQDA